MHFSRSRVSAVEEESWKCSKSAWRGRRRGGQGAVGWGHGGRWRGVLACGGGGGRSLAVRWVWCACVEAGRQSEPTSADVLLLLRAGARAFQPRTPALPTCPATHLHLSIPLMAVSLQLGKHILDVVPRDEVLLYRHGGSRRKGAGGSACAGGPRSGTAARCSHRQHGKPHAARRKPMSWLQHSSQGAHLELAAARCITVPAHSQRHARQQSQGQPVVGQPMGAGTPATSLPPPPPPPPPCRHHHHRMRRQPKLTCSRTGGLPS